MRRNTFFKIFVLSITLVLLVFATSIICIHQVGTKMTQERLVNECQIVRRILSDEVEIETLTEYYRENPYRITVIKENGDVWYDSEPGDNSFENHSDREEFQSADFGSGRVVSRNSQTFGSRMFYYAEKVLLTDNTVVVLRLTIRSNEVGEYVVASLPFLLIALVVAIAFSAWFSKKISANVSEKVTAVGRSLKSLNDGEYKPLETNVKEQELFSVYTEINELNKSVHNRILSEERESKKLSQVLDNISQGIIALNQNGEIVFVNNSAINCFLGTGDYVGKKLGYLISSTEILDKIAAPVDKNHSFEYKLDERELSITVKNISDSTLSGVVSDIIIVTDITNEKNIVRQKSDLFANASHELKTPITVMQGLTELLMSKESIDDGSKKQIERIHKESLRMGSLIGDMLKLSKLERTENIEDRVLATVDLRSVCDEVINELSNEMSQKNISHKIVGEGTVIADPKKIFELVANLCANAVNYNKENGNIEITIESGEKQTLLWVKDTGIGIEKEHLPRLCERFYRVDKSRSKKTGGTGLGLAIVKHICALYGAELSISSEINVGTSVCVKFNKKAHQWANVNPYL